jgi:hypothetical protein
MKLARLRLAGTEEPIMTAQLESTDKGHQDEKTKQERKKEEKDLDKALEDSFPGSDPVSITQPVPEPNRSEKERNAKRQ